MNINVELKNVNYIKHNNFEDIEVTENGEYTASEGYDAIGKAVVNVEPNLEEIEITENGEYLPSEGKDGFSKVDVLVQPDTQEIEITENGEYTPEDGYIGFSKVDVNVETYEPPLNLVLLNPVADSNINLPITFQWNIDNLEQGETLVYYLFVDDNLVYKGNNTSYTMQVMPIAGRNHTCYIIANSESRSGFTDIINFSLPYEFLYGFDIDQDNEDPTDAVTYTDDCLNFTPAGLDNNDIFQFGSWKTFIDRLCRPVMLRTDGTVDYELDHDNLINKIDGSISDIQNTNYDGNVMVEFKKTYTKVWQEGNIIKVRFCDVKLDSDYQAWAFVNDDGVEQDELYISMFQAYNKGNNKLASLAVSTSFYYPNLDYISSSDAFNAFMKNGYGRLSYTMYQFILLLHILISKSRKFKDNFGYVYERNSIQIDTLSNGGFTGKKEQKTDIRSFYIQYLFSVYINSTNCATLIDGINLDKTSHKFIIKHTRPYVDIKNGDINTDGYINTGVTINNSYSYLKSMTVKNGILLPHETDSNMNLNYNTYINVPSSFSNRYYIIGLASPNSNPYSMYGMKICNNMDGYRLATFITYLKPSNNS